MTVQEALLLGEILGMLCRRRLVVRPVIVAQLEQRVH